MLLLFFNVDLKNLLNIDFTLRYESFFSDCAFNYVNKVFKAISFQKNRFVVDTMKEKNEKGRQNEIFMTFFWESSRALESWINWLSDSGWRNLNEFERLWKFTNCNCFRQHKRRQVGIILTFFTWKLFNVKWKFHYAVLSWELLQASKCN